MLPLSRGGHSRVNRTCRGIPDLSPGSPEEAAYRTFCPDKILDAAARGWYDAHMNINTKRFIAGIFSTALVLTACEMRPETATIGGTPVPALDCEEDEVITFVAVDTLACTNIDWFLDD